MGAAVFKLITKKGKEPCESKATSLFELEAKSIEGTDANLGAVLQGKKCTLVVNVATKWGLTDQNYKEMVQLHE